MIAAMEAIAATAMGEASTAMVTMEVVVAMDGGDDNGGDDVGGGDGGSDDGWRW